MEGREIDYCVQGGRKYTHTLYIPYAVTELLSGPLAAISCEWRRRVCERRRESVRGEEGGCVEGRVRGRGRVRDEGEYVKVASYPGNP